MLVNLDKITDIFYAIDEFYLENGSQIDALLLPKQKKRPYKKRKLKMSYSEVMTILVIFHLSGYTSLKHFYIYYVCKHLNAEFSTPVSYNRFVELQGEVLFHLTLFLKYKGLGNCSGISFIDSTKLAVCHSKGIKANKVFKDIATIGKSTMGWFYGFKLHIVINDKGELIDFVFTKANCDDRNPIVMNPISKKLSGKLFGDKGYISKELFQGLFVNGIQLITQIRKNMKNHLMTTSDKILLRKRALIETVNDQLKNICQIEHTRHRSPWNFLINAIAGLIGYCYLPKKPSLKLEFDYNSPTLF